MNLYNLKRNILKVWDIIYVKVNSYIIRKNTKLNVMSLKRTIEYIKKNNCSISRFGDGEFDIMLQKGEPNFQKGSPEISIKLLQVFTDKPDNLLICIPYSLVSTKGFRKEAKRYWDWWSFQKQKEIVQLLIANSSDKYLFGDSYVSRPFTAYNSYEFSKSIFKSLKELWVNTDVLIVEGVHTCLGVGNDLFEKTRSIKRILAPSINAFERYEEIKNTVLSVWNGELVILALGPTASILAFDLSKNNIQALDLGHIDIQYEWYLKNDKSFSAIKGKYVNETKDKSVLSQCENIDYVNSIVAKIL